MGFKVISVVALVLGGVGVVPAHASAADSMAESVREQVRATSPTSAELNGRSGTSGASPASAASAASRLMRCFDLGGPRYCLGVGFTDTEPTPAAAASRPLDSETRGGSGALSEADFVAQRSAMTDKERADAEVAEVDMALAGATKAKSLMQATASTKTSNYIMYGYQTRQAKSYWCGVATFQSIDWADDKQRDTQESWAKDLGTTTSGTSIANMVSLTNSKTNWDAKAGTYIVQSVASWTADQFFTVHRNHLGDAQPAPIIEHPQLLKTYFPYLKYSHSGHFTVGRGYAASNKSISYFEVFNEADWNSSGNQTWGVRFMPAATLLAATKANTSFKNIGL